MLLDSLSVSPNLAAPVNVCVRLPIFHHRNPWKDVVLHVRTVVPPLHMYTWLSGPDSPVRLTVCKQISCHTWTCFRVTVVLIKFCSLTLNYKFVTFTAGLGVCSMYLHCCGDKINYSKNLENVYLCLPNRNLKNAYYVSAYNTSYTTTRKTLENQVMHFLHFAPNKEIWPRYDMSHAGLVFRV